MNRTDYRAAFDAVEFRPDFQEDTIQRLTQGLGQPNEKEQRIMELKRAKRITVLVAATVAVLALSVSAAVLWLTPAQTAEQLSDPVLAEAFDGKDAVLLNETVQSEDYTITLGGLVSGKGISQWCSDADETRTYAMVSLARTDGVPLDGDTFSFFEHTITPLVAGYPVWQLNTWTLDSGARSFIEDGRAYYILDTMNLQMFADRTVYLAVYAGSASPSTEMFDMAEDGSISFAEGFPDAHALFTLPLDSALADPEAAARFAEDLGISVLP